MQARPLVPIIASAGILLGANGLMLTLIAVRAKIEGFPDTSIGLMGTGYFCGVFLACLLTPKMIQRSGHIRVFASLSALAAISTLVIALIVNPGVWVMARMVMGLCFAGIAMVIESWLNQLAGDSSRGRILSIYRVVDLSAVTGAQFLLPAIGPEGSTIFMVTAIFFCLALLPVALSGLKSPQPPESTSLRPGFLWSISPVACIGCVTIGLTNAAFRSVGPVYAEVSGLDVQQVAWFMSLGIFAGALFQYPLGWLSDRFNRRNVLILATLGAAVGSALLAQPGTNLIYLGAFTFGGFALPLYALSAAHANDFAKPGQHVDMAAGLAMFFAFGGIVGPFMASTLIDEFGARSFFVYTAVLHANFIVFILFRMTRRAAVPKAMRKRFVSLLRTSPMFFRLSGLEDEDELDREAKPAQPGPTQPEST